MAEELELELERTIQPAKVAQRLRSLADQLVAGAVTIDEEVIPIPDSVYLTIEFEEQHEDDDVSFEIEVELAWPVRFYEEDDETEEDEEEE